MNETEGKTRRTAADGGDIYVNNKTIKILKGKRSKRKIKGQGTVGYIFLEHKMPIISYFSISNMVTILFLKLMPLTFQNTYVILLYNIML